MRLTALFLISIFLHVHAVSTYSQTTRLTLDLKDVSIEDALNTIEEKSEFYFLYNSKLIDVDRIVNVKAKAKPIENVLADIFAKTDVIYKIEDRQIILSKSEYITEKSPHQQRKVIMGTVLDIYGEPVIGANVVEKGIANGAITDVDGNFALELPSNAVIQISYIGYISQELVVGNQQNLRIILKEDNQALDEIVVVGYGVQRKSDVTGSIAIAKSEDILKQQSFSALDGLKGKASGVNIFTNSGQPGGGSRVMIRGIGTINSSSDPLYVVDGVVMEEFKYLNPNDIERIEVLKDASSAAIYGARGANGVILVTTKRGKDTEGIQLSYSGSVTVSTMSKYLDVLNAEEYFDAMMQSYENANKWYGKNYSLNRADHFKDPNLFHADGTPIYDTDWQRESTRTSFSHNHQLNIQQGGKNSSMGAFLNYTDQQGIMLNNYMKRLNTKLTYDAKPTDWVSTAINLLVNHTWGNEVVEGGGNNVPRRSMIEMVPFLPVKFPDGTWASSATITDNLGLEGFANPVHMLETQQHHRYRTQIFGNAALTFHLLPGLDLKTQLGIDAHINKTRNYSPNDLENESSPNGAAHVIDGNVLYWQEETYLTYLKNADKHRINLMMGLSWQERTYRENSVYTEGFSDNFYGTDNLGVGTLPQAPKSSYESWAMNSYFLRGAYTYDDRYMATITARVDGSSRFGDNNKYAFFPSAGLGWLVSNESFMESVTAIDQLKLHTSYGITGNTEIGAYKSLATISSGTVLLNGIRVPSSHTSRLANPDLKWEKTSQFDIGFNLNLFRNRLNFDVSYYYKLTSDLLLDRPVPQTTGFSTVVDNIGSIANQGVDFLLNSVNIATKDFEWTSALNLNYNKNKIKALGENDEDIEPGPNWVSGSQIILRVGESLSSFWGYERLGIWGENEAEEAKAAGANVGEAKRSPQKKVLGKGVPDLTGSFINNFRYKNLDLTIDMQFVTGVDILQQFFHSTEDRFGYANGLSSLLHEAWSPTNTNTQIQAVRNAVLTGQNSELDSHWVSDGSYLRANMIQLGYTFSPKLLKSMKLSSLRAYLSVNNAFLIHSKDFKGYDPEGSSHEGNQWGQNMFFHQYPKPRTYTLGANITF